MLQQLHVGQFSNEAEVHRPWPWKSPPHPLSSSNLSTHSPLHSTAVPNQEGSQHSTVVCTSQDFFHQMHSLSIVICCCWRLATHNTLKHEKVTDYKDSVFHHLLHSNCSLQSSALDTIILPPHSHRLCQRHTICTGNCAGDQLLPKAFCGDMTITDSQ